MPKSPNHQEYKDAVWEFLMEHCEVLPSGTLFFKFHGKGRQNVEKRIYARFYNEYHREDTESKEIESLKIQVRNLEEKLDRQKKYARNRLKGQLKLIKINIIKFFRDGLDELLGSIGCDPTEEPTNHENGKEEGGKEAGKKAVKKEVKQDGSI